MQNSSLFLSFHFAFRLLLSLSCSLVAAAALADPSARVGRIAYLEGDVQLRASEQGESAQASVNWPLTGGNIITTAPNARTEIRIGSSVIRLDGQSELLMTAIDDNRLALYLPYGSATVRILNAEVAREFNLQTPQAQVTLLQPGRLRIDAGRNAPTTSLHMIDGAARFDALPAGQGGQPGLIVAAGVRLDSNNGFSQITSLRTPAANDSFDGWSLARDRNDDRAQSNRYVSVETTGYEELDRNGIWRTTAEYGPVWTPTVVAADWAPYRYGRWLWVAPWGWTWVDNASWGYAPSHYGRWVSIDNRWCWTPGAVVAHPVWAPAVVGWQVGVSFNGSSWAQRPPTTGWFPLAPREVYLPSYSVSRTYVERVNINHITNVTQINNFYRGRDDDRDHVPYRYRALAGNVTPTAAVPVPAPSGHFKDFVPQRYDGRQQGAQFMTAPGSPAARSRAATPSAAVVPVPVPAQLTIHSPAQSPVQLPVQLPVQSRIQAPAFASVPVAAPAKMMAPSPVTSPAPAEHPQHQRGRSHYEEQRAAAPVMMAPALAVASPQPPRTASAPAARPPPSSRNAHYDHHEAHEPAGRNGARERRER